MQSNKMIGMILAATPKGEIGYMNTIPWKLKGDLFRFKLLTGHQNVIMGRNTFESLSQPLAERNNIVVSASLCAAFASDKLHSLPRNVVYTDSLEYALAIADQDKLGDYIWIIGGARIYEEALAKKIPNEIYLTTVYKEAPEGYDTHIKNFSLLDYRLEDQPIPVYEPDQITGLMILTHTYSKYVRNYPDSNLDHPDGAVAPSEGTGPQAS